MSNLFTPGPWAVHKDFKTVVVPQADAEKHIGGSIYPDQEAARYAKIIAREDGTEFPEFHRSRVMPDEAAANALLIAAAPEMYEALKELIRCVRGGDETAGVSMDDALLDADEALAKAVKP
jgi:hypothetical protein